MKNILLLDFETTGLDPTKHAPLEFTASIVTLPSFVEVDRYESGPMIVQPGDEVTDEALNVNGYDRGALRLGRDRTLVASDFHQFILRYFPNGNVTLMAHNPRLDYGMLQKMYEEWLPGQFAKTFSYRVIDTMSLAAGYALFHEVDMSVSLAGLCSRFSIVNTAPHTSAGDVEAMRLMAKALFGVVYGGEALPDVPLAVAQAPNDATLVDHTAPTNETAQPAAPADTPPVSNSPETVAPERQAQSALDSVPEVDPEPGEVEAVQRALEESKAQGTKSLDEVAQELGVDIRGNEPSQSVPPIGNPSLEPAQGQATSGDSGEGNTEPGKAEEAQDNSNPPQVSASTGQSEVSNDTANPQPSADGSNVSGGDQ